MTVPCFADPDAFTRYPIPLLEAYRLASNCCADCPIRVQCLQQARGEEYPVGIYGGEDTP